MYNERLHWEEQYEQGTTPWDTHITPPEVIAFWADRPAPGAGIALDLGCGTATNVAYLARLGLTVYGCDLALTALIMGRQRLQQASALLLTQVCLFQADATRLPLHNLGANYVLDIGCLHGVPAATRPSYAAGVINNLAAGGFYQLYAFDYLGADDAKAYRPARGLHQDEVVELFTPALRVVEILRARPDRHPCRWYLLQKA
jgi:SAM-dependent methyltransferase